MTQAISAFVNPIHQTALRNGTSLRQQPLTLLQPKSIIYYAPRSRVSLIMAVDDDSTKDEHVGEEPPKFTQKFDPESETVSYTHSSLYCDTLSIKSSQWSTNPCVVA